MSALERADRGDECGIERLCSAADRALAATPVRSGPGLSTIIRTREPTTFRLRFGERVDLTAPIRFNLR